MLLRVWRVALAPGRSADLRQFVRDHSLPMFGAQAGCLGVFFTSTEKECATVTLWDSERSVAAMESSERYRSVVRRIEESGILGDDHRTEVLGVFDGYVDPELSRRLLGS